MAARQARKNVAENVSPVSGNYGDPGFGFVLKAVFLQPLDHSGVSYLDLPFSTKRKVVVVIRERGRQFGSCQPGSESQAASFIRARIAKGTKVFTADESGAWDGLHERFEMKRINHFA